jgi:hypothetical protein
MPNTNIAEHWVCTNPNCQQANPQLLSEFLFRPLTGTRYKECSTCRKARLRANQRRRKEARIAFKEARRGRGED